MYIGLENDAVEMERIIFCSFQRRFLEEVVNIKRGKLTAYMFIGLRLKHVKTRARLIGTSIAKVAASKFIKILARIDASFHGRQDSPWSLHASISIADTIRSISLSDTSFILKLILLQQMWPFLTKRLVDFDRGISESQFISLYYVFHILNLKFFEIKCQYRYQRINLNNK